MSSWLSGWHPVKSFPQYSGQHDVGTVDVEIPTADLPVVADGPADAPPTIAFRIFYPCVAPSGDEVDRPVHWIPQPQRETIAAFAKFVGLKERVAGILSYLPQQLYWIKLPAHRNAKLLDATTSNGRWPVCFFSHGLAGSRNAYSQICGDLASHGMIVIALDHRDGSSPIQYIRATVDTKAHIVPPVKIPHNPITAEVYAGRDKQLRIRLWEISMVYEALVKIDAGEEVQNLDSNTSRIHKKRVEVLWQFSDALDIHRPGKVIWAGHSFGAATTVQLLKSVFYHGQRQETDGQTLIAPKADAAIIGQIMPESPCLLLDMWGLPLQSPEQKFLWERPLPSYAAGGPNGTNILSVLSEAFQNWEDNLNINKHVIAEPQRSRRPSVAPRLAREKGQLLPSWARLRAPSPSSDSGYASETSHSLNLRRQISHGSCFSTPSQPLSERRGRQRNAGPSAGPHMFYAQMSQHFSQSDFGVLFPWIAQRITKAEEPERVLHLNIRAMVQVVREAGIEVAGDDDWEILDTASGIRRWRAITVYESSVTDPCAVMTIDRKLSVTSTRNYMPATTPRDGMTMGQKMEAQLDQLTGA